jgi:hypothetical protein
MPRPLPTIVFSGERHDGPFALETREHIIADLSAHHVEGPIVRCGFTAERVVHDYGVDLYMTTYTAQGEVENDVVLFQLKGTDQLMRTPSGS